MRAEPSWQIPRKPTKNLKELLIELKKTRYTSAWNEYDGTICIREFTVKSLQSP